jgi:cobalt/nickel transport system permease protein
MHIPDNFLSTPVWASLDAVALPSIALVSRRAQRQVETSNIALLGIMGAFVFAAQMINFPVGIGTSGHLVGGTLLAALFGPWAAALTVTAILIVQALVFQDGGVLALGANVINMALIGVLAGYLPIRLLQRTRWEMQGVFAGAFCSVLVSGILALTELLLSGIHVTPTLTSVSLGLFTVNALIEGAITISVLKAVRSLQTRENSVQVSVNNSCPAIQRTARLLGVMALGTVTIATVGILIASHLPDGLEHLALRLGIPFGGGVPFESPLRDYQLQSLGPTWFSRASAGLLGLILIYFVCVFGGFLLTRSRRSYS